MDRPNNKNNHTYAVIDSSHKWKIPDFGYINSTQIYRFIHKESIQTVYKIKLTYYQKPLRRNLIWSKIHKWINIFCGFDFFNCYDYVVFHWFLPFSLIFLPFTRKKSSRSRCFVKGTYEFNFQLYLFPNIGYFVFKF